MQRNENLHVLKNAELLGHRAAVYALAAGALGHEVFSAGGDGLVAKWDLRAPDQGLAVAQMDANIFSLCFVPEKNWLVAGDMNGGVRWIDLQNGQAFKNSAFHKKGTFAIQKIDNQIITIGGEGTMTWWDLESARPMESLNLSNKSLRCMDFCPQSRVLAVGGSDKNIYFVNADSRELLGVLQGAHGNSVFCVKFSPNGQTLYSGGRDALLKTWPLNAASIVPDASTPTSSIPAHWYTVNDIVFNKKGNLFATASRDKTVKIWNAADCTLLKVIDVSKYWGHTHSVNRLLWLENNELLSASDDKKIIVWKLDLLR